MTDTTHAIEHPHKLVHWLRSFGLMLLWELKSMRLVLPLAILVQILIGAGMIVGYGFLLGDIPVEVALYMATGVITQVLVFFIILFSPLSYPPDRLPEWFAALHRVLPFQHAANVMRASLTDGLAADVGPSFAVLAAWAMASWVLTAWVVGRRG